MQINEETGVYPFNSEKKSLFQSFFSLAVPHVGLWSMILAFPGHMHLLTLYMLGSSRKYCVTVQQQK